MLIIVEGKRFASLIPRQADKDRERDLLWSEAFAKHDVREQSVERSPLGARDVAPHAAVLPGAPLRAGTPAIATCGSLAPIGILHKRRGPRTAIPRESRSEACCLA